MWHHVALCGLFSKGNLKQTELSFGIKKKEANNISLITKFAFCFTCYFMKGKDMRVTLLLAPIAIGGD
jgi:hypothetical protein